MAFVGAIFEALALSRGARAAIPTFTAIVEATPLATVTRVFEQARALGAVFRDSEGRQIIRQLQANIRVRERFQLTPRGRKPALSSLGRTLTPLKSGKNTTTVVNIRGFSRREGKIVVRPVQIQSNRILSPFEAEKAALALAPSGPETEPLINVTAEAIEQKLSITNTLGL